MSQDLRLTNENIMRAKEDHSFREELFNKNIQMVYDATHRQCSVKSPEFQDLFQESAIVFLRCIDTFDPTKGAKFSSLFYRSVFLKIRSKRVDEERKKHLKFSKYDYYLMMKVYAIRQNNPLVTEEEIAQELGVTVADVRAAASANYSNKPMSIDQITTEGEAQNSEHTLAEVVKSDEDTELEVVSQLTRQERVARLMEILPDRHKEILTLFLGGFNQRQIAEELGIQPNRVYKSLKKIVNVYVPMLDEEPIEV